MQVDESQIVNFGRNEGKIVNRTYMEAREQAANYTTPRKLQLDQRRSLVMYLRREKQMQMEEIVEYMRSQGEKYLLPGQKYTSTNVKEDLRAGLRTLAEETAELAKDYLADELADLEFEQEEVKELAGQIKGLLDRTTPTIENIEDYEKASRTYDRMMERLDRIRSRRSKYLPMEAPKKVDVRQQTVYGSVDEFIKRKKEIEKLKKEKEEQVVEGEFVET